jgi:hypothetical protein
MVLVNSLPPPSQLGAVNGAGQTLASLVRGLGPLTGGLLWGVALRVPHGAFLVFGLCACIAAGALLLFAGIRPLALERGGAARCGSGGGEEA